MLFQRDTQTEARRLFGSTYNDQELIFCEPSGEFLESDLLSQTIVRRLRKAGVKGASLQRCVTRTPRHCSPAGCRLRPYRSLGHAQPRVTNRV